MKDDDKCTQCLGLGVCMGMHFGPFICPKCRGDGRYRSMCGICKGMGVVVRQVTRSRVFGKSKTEAKLVRCETCRGRKTVDPT